MCACTSCVLGQYRRMDSRLFPDCKCVIMPPFRTLTTNTVADSTFATEATSQSENRRWRQPWSVDGTVSTKVRFDKLNLSTVRNCTAPTCRTIDGPDEDMGGGMKGTVVVGPPERYEKSDLPAGCGA